MVLIPFHTNDDYGGKLLINTDVFLHNYLQSTVITLKHFYHSAWFVK